MTVNTLQAVVFDWAGTMIDFGCRAPVVALRHVFAEAGIEVTESEARADMGKLRPWAQEVLQSDDPQALL